MLSTLYSGYTGMLLGRQASNQPTNRPVLRIHWHVAGTSSKQPTNQQTCTRDTLACCWDVKQATNQPTDLYSGYTGMLLGRQPTNQPTNLYSGDGKADHPLPRCSHGWSFSVDLRGFRNPSSVMVYHGMVLQPSETLISLLFQSLWWNVCVHRLDHNLFIYLFVYLTVWILWLVETASFKFNLHISVAAHKIVGVGSSRRYNLHVAGTLSNQRTSRHYLLPNLQYSIEQPRNKQTLPAPQPTVEYWATKEQADTTCSPTCSIEQPRNKQTLPAPQPTVQYWATKEQADTTCSPTYSRVLSNQGTSRHYLLPNLQQC